MVTFLLRLIGCACLLAALVMLWAAAPENQAPYFDPVTRRVLPPAPGWNVAGIAAATGVAAGGLLWFALASGLSRLRDIAEIARAVLALLERQHAGVTPQSEAPVAAVPQIEPAELARRLAVQGRINRADVAAVADSLEARDRNAVPAQPLQPRRTYEDSARQMLDEARARVTG